MFGFFEYDEISIEEADALIENAEGPTWCETSELVQAQCLVAEITVLLVEAKNAARQGQRFTATMKTNQARKKARRLVKRLATVPKALARKSDSLIATDFGSYPIACSASVEAI